jgi:hypothetical protein
MTEAHPSVPWQPISTAPRGKPVVVWDAGDVSVAVHQPSTGKWCGLVDGGLVGMPTARGVEFFEVFKPTHWMPIPLGPNGETPSSAA